MSKNKKLFAPADQQKTLLLCSYVLGSNKWDIEDYFEEFKSLVDTAEMDFQHELVFKLRNIDSSNFLTKGKLEELTRFCHDNQIERIIVSSSLTGVQQRNLENSTATEVIDRTQLILEIFKQSATTAEGKLQVEIAGINIAKTRLAGMGHEMAQQQFGVGSRGPGETEKEFMTRFYAEEILKAEKKLKSMETSRQVQRKRRLNSGKPILGLVGYTNAGKSSVLNALQNKEDVLAKDKLFATLDTATRELFIDQNHQFLICDTVGFISELPHHLIRAFKSTLDELRYATLLLHVVDISNNSWQDQVQVVLKTLEDIEISVPMVFLFNKIDKLTKKELAPMKKHIKEYYPEHIFIHTMSKEGIEPLLDLLKKHKLLQPRKKAA